MDKHSTQFQREFLSKQNANLYPIKLKNVTNHKIKLQTLLLTPSLSTHTHIDSETYSHSDDEVFELFVFLFGDKSFQACSSLDIQTHFRFSCC